MFSPVQTVMPSIRRQKTKSRKSREMGMMSDMDNLDVMLGYGDSNPIERELADAIEQSSVQGDIETNMHQRVFYRDFSCENDSFRQNGNRQFVHLESSFSIGGLKLTSHFPESRKKAN